MIKFFRNIRQRLLFEGKTTNYLKYAIGEIVLVVIGILIALQINNWNQSRLNRIEEKNILANLHDEFLENKKMLDSTTIIYKSAIKANMVLMGLIGKNAEELQKNNLDSLFSASLPSSQIVFSNNTIKNIVQTGKLDIIENPEIIKLINQWDGATIMMKEREQTLKTWVDDKVIPILNDYVSFKEIDNNLNMPWGGKTQLQTDYFTLFHLLKYENIQDNFLWYHNKNLVGILKANDVIVKIIDATEPYKY